MSDAVVITVSDSRSGGQAPDASGPAACEIIQGWGLAVRAARCVPDDAAAIAQHVRTAAGEASLVVLTGGTGIGPRDVTPEAVRPLLDRELPGFGEIMRTGSFAQTPLSIISRGGAGVIGRSLVIMLPGSPRGVRECLELVGPAARHVLKVLEGGKMNCQGEPGGASR